MGTPADQFQNRLDRRALLGGFACAAAGVAMPARAQLTDFFGISLPQGNGTVGVPQPALPAPTVDYLAVAREQLARNAHAIAFQDRVGIVDFGLPSASPRFALVDLVAGKVQHFAVTHGRGSDPEHDGWLKRFSNRPGSLASSRGAYRTADYYWGQHGSSMRLSGLEADNDMADARAIVVHGAWYADPALIAQQGKLGRSEGCFVFGQDQLPEVLYKLGPGRLLFADKLSTPPPPVPMTPAPQIAAVAGAESVLP